MDLMLMSSHLPVSSSPLTARKTHDTSHNQGVSYAACVALTVFDLPCPFYFSSNVL